MASPARLFQKTRNDIIKRLRIGHTSCTHRHLVTREDPPNCTACGVQLTIKHIFTECRNNQQDRIETLGATILYIVYIIIITPESAHGCFRKGVIVPLRLGNN